MKIGLVGPSYQTRSKPFDAQRTINLYPVLDETGQGKEIAALYGTPGLRVEATPGNGPIRAEFASANGRAFVVSGSGLYEIFENGTDILRGTLNTTTSVCTVDENTTQLTVCDGADLYTFTYASNVFAQVTDADFPGATSVTFLDQYTIVNRPDTGEFYVSALGDATSWDALDFATAESSPDKLNRVYAAYGQLWLFGNKTTEVWYNSGSAFPFTRVEGAKMQVGIAAKFSVVDMDNSIYWLGRDDKGKNIVYMAQGYTAVRVSTHAVEEALKNITDYDKVQAYAYQEYGHLFYVLTGGGLKTTWVYDAATKQWHERAYLEASGELSTHRAATHMFVFGKHLVGDKSSGTIYEMSSDYYSDNGDEILSQRTFVHLHNENKRFNVHELQVDFESGVGLTTGQGSDPKAWLRTSNDGGRTWGPPLETSIGKIGEYKKRAVWRRLGQFDLFTAEISITDPVKRAICGAYIR